MEKENIKVSVVCTVFNHEKFLRKCLDGFIMQKTNFDYEVLINEDASTDGSKLIIKEYAKKYPDIIKPIYQTENQYSKNIPIIDEILMPKAKGKYIAFCEGDDCWCDENKLQVQYDYMEKHKECSMCVHNTLKHDLLNRKKDTLFNTWKSHNLTENEIFFNWKVHTSSYFFRREAMDVSEEFDQYWFGDYVRLTLAHYYGEIHYIDKLMSIYNLNNKEGVTYQNNNDSKEKMIKKYSEIPDYLEKYNKYTNYKLNDAVTKRIKEIKLQLKLISINAKNREDFKKTKKELKSNNYYKDYFKNRKFEKIVYTFKFSNYINYKIFIKFENYIKKIRS